MSASETQAGRRWDEAKIKALTGGEPISARFMRGDFFTFIPHFKLLFVGNHKPQIRDIDDAMRRRVIMIPFTVKPKVIDKELSQKLEAEYPAILAWIIEGAIKWGRDGLAPAGVVQSTTEEYFAEEDPIARWLEEECEEDPVAVTKTTALYQRWTEWANQHGEYVGSQKRFVQSLRSRGFEKAREGGTGKATMLGLRLRPATLGF